MRLVGIIFACFFNLVVNAQPTVRLLRENIKIGEQTELLYQVKAKTISNFKFPFSKKKISCDLIGNKSKKQTELEIIGRFNDTLLKTNSGDLWEGSYMITCWDSGTVVIPSLEFTHGDSLVKFLPLRLQVTSPKIIDGKDVYDIRTYFQSLPNSVVSFFTKYGWWLVVLIVVSIVILRMIQRSKKSKIEEINTVVLSLKARTVKSINELNAEKLWEHGALKEHYVRLSYILRYYLAARFRLGLLDKTSFQIGVLLSKCDLHPTIQKDIQQVLDQSDLVKFAKSQPIEQDVINMSLIAIDIVEKTSPSDE
jgi:hypothetical protein